MILKTLATIFIVTTFSISAWAAEHNVEIKNFKFTPAEITVMPGDTVKFINLDSAPHSVVPDANSKVSFDSSSIMQTDDEFVLEITESEDLLAKCGVHPNMPGLSVVVVSEAEQIIIEMRENLNRLEKVLNNE